MFDFGNLIGFTILIGVAVPIIVTVLIVVAIIRSFRRVMPTGKAAAQQELQARLARGEISPAEYEATMDAIKNQS